MANPFDPRDPLGRSAAQLDRLLQPLRDHQRLVDTALEPVREHDRMMRAFLKPYQDSEELLRKQLGAVGIPEQLSALTRGLEQANALAGSFHRETAMLSKMYEALTPRSWRDIASMASHMPPAFLLEIEQMAGAIDLVKIEGATRNHVLIDGTLVTYASVQHLAAQLSEDVQTLQVADQLPSALTKLKEEFDLTNPAVRLYLLLVLLVISSLYYRPTKIPAIVGVNLFAALVAKEALTPEAKKVARKFRSLLRLKDEDIREVIVQLDVRQSARRNSPRLGILQPREMVRVQKQVAGWSLVESVEESGYKGWVFTRYLRKP